MKKDNPPRPVKINSSYQPPKAELEADVGIPATPDELLQAVFDYDPRSNEKSTREHEKK